MAKEKFEFYLAMDGEAPKDPEKFQKSMRAAYVNGVEPIEYREDTLLDENNNVVTTLILVRCRQRWNGAAKRFFRKTKFSDLNQKVDGLHVYG